LECQEIYGSPKPSTCPTRLKKRERKKARRERNRRKFAEGKEGVVGEKKTNPKIDNPCNNCEGPHKKKVPGTPCPLWDITQMDIREPRHSIHRQYMRFSRNMEESFCILSSPLNRRS